MLASDLVVRLAAAIREYADQEIHVQDRQGFHVAPKLAYEEGGDHQRPCLSLLPEKERGE